MKLCLSPINIKLEFEKSRETTKSPETLINEIPYVLARLDYEILPNTDSTISFKYGWWNLSKGKRLSKLETGNFEIVTLNDKTCVKLIYRSSILGEIIFFILISMFCLISFEALFIIVPILIQLYFRINLQKQESEAILDEIINKN